jgi:hypothetical protein
VSMRGRHRHDLSTAYTGPDLHHATFGRQAPGEHPLFHRLPARARPSCRSPLFGHRATLLVSRQPPDTTYPCAPRAEPRREGEITPATHHRGHTRTAHPRQLPHALSAATPCLPCTRPRPGATARATVLGSALPAAPLSPIVLLSARNPQTSPSRRKNTEHQTHSAHAQHGSG